MKMLMSKSFKLLGVKISVPGIRKYKLPVCGFLKLKSEHQWI
jgi:hypothetical protein